MFSGVLAKANAPLNFFCLQREFLDAHGWSRSESSIM
jgi:hypothetical protein